jgi:multidrug efflux pump subunit AcrA (membrane-fusion protein)
MKLRYLILPTLAIGGIALTVYTIRQMAKPIPPPEIPIEPNASPYRSRLAGIGTVEPESEVIEIGSPAAGIVEVVAVVEGQRVEPSDLLFTIDTREVRQKLAVAEAEVATAKSKLAQLDARPRAEDVARAAALVAARQASLSDAKDRLARFDRVGANEELAPNERPSLVYAVERAAADLAAAEADLAQAKVGTYPEDRAAAEADVRLAEARRDDAAGALARREVRSPIAGTVLEVEVRLGTYASSGPQAPRLVTIGDLEPLQVRVDIDELDLWRFRPDGRAVAMLRGSGKREFPLRFVRMVPQVTPKRTLSGEMGERMDTRVMQAIYAIEGDARPLMPGQVVDVFIEAEEGSAAGAVDDGVR